MESLNQSEGGLTWRVRVRVEKQAVKGRDPQVGACSTCVYLFSLSTI
jgi:hypothetical protein